MEVDPGISEEAVDEDYRIPLAKSEANVMPDQILASLDGDTRNYLKLLLQGAGEGLGGKAKSYRPRSVASSRSGKLPGEINRASPSAGGTSSARSPVSAT